MNLATVLHNKAMEFADEALLAKMEGNSKVSEALFAKAFALEKEAATSIDEEDKRNTSRFILLRTRRNEAHSCPYGQ